jgi:hypothetical protein
MIAESRPVECDKAHIWSGGSGLKGVRALVMEEALMTKQNQNQQIRKIELDLHDLESVSGGTRKAGKGQQEFLTVKFETVLVSSYQ